MTYFIVFIIIILVVWHFKSKHEINVNVAKEGGMQHKYRNLVDMIQGLYPHFQVTKLSHNSITLSYSSAAGYECFVIMQQIRQVNIIWEVKTFIHGKHKLDWSFHEFENPETIIDRVVNDISKYQTNILTK